jgi:chemotaxis protein CheZ
MRRRADPALGALDGFARIAAALERTREDLAALHGPEASAARRSAANAQLDALARDAEGAASRIMAAAEAILAAPDRAAIAREVEAIFEACAFHDIAGQRVRKVRETLAAIEQAHGLDGPQIDGPATAQADIDRLMAG